MTMKTIWESQWMEVASYFGRGRLHKTSDLKKPRTIWIAFLQGRIWASADTREELNLRNLSDKDPRLQIKQFMEIP